MSKQERANAIFNRNVGVGRQFVIDMIVSEVGVSSAYASTLYNNARKAAPKSLDETRKPELWKGFDQTPKTTKKIDRLDRPTLRMLRGELETALSTVANKYGLTIDIGSMSFTANDFTTRLKVAVGSSDDAAKREWEMYAPMFGLKAEDFGRSFTSRGTRFTVTGIANRSRKFPILATNANGTVYKFQTNVLK